MKRKLKRFLVLFVATFLMAESVQAAVFTNMTYRTNEVVLKGENGISITSGSYEVKEFCITPGQDPEGKNFTGQLHELENGKFVFEVGRQGSEDVADWFNEKLSGYNDKSINGDRTTFDHTAEKLNFAFIGELRLKVTLPENSQEIEVTFPDAAFAQGNTGLRNNWWFGQLSGQHTQDSDGENSVLAIGTDSAGNTVYASFVRGGNEVNEVLLESICVLDEARNEAVKIPNVENAFQQINTESSVVQMGGIPGNYESVVNHIQGYSQYFDTDGTAYSILTHSVSDASYAHIVCGEKGTDEVLGYKTFLQDWTHPGGIQTIGDYLLVSCEEDDESHVALYDLRSLKVQQLKRVETFDLQLNHKAGALGITTYTDRMGDEYYLLIVANLDGTDSVYHIYRASTEQGIEQASFAEVGSFPMDKDFQGFGLVTEAGSNNVYMIGLLSVDEAASYADYAYLYQIDTQNWTIGNEIAQKHMYSQGGAAGIMGVHFRYGAGISVTPEEKLVISATERNAVFGSSVAINDWTE